MIDFYGKDLKIAYISNGINAYSIEPQLWMKFDKEYNFVIASAIVVHNDLNYINASIEKKFSSSSKIGFSNHYKGILGLMTAYTLGAEVLEFHYTLDKKMKGTDHQLSLDIQDVNILLGAISDIEVALGGRSKQIEKCELPALEKLRSDI